MAAYSSLSIKLSDATTVTLTLPSTMSFREAQEYVQNFAGQFGFWDNVGVWHPSSAIVSVSLS